MALYIWCDTSLEAYQSYNRAFGTSEAVGAENLAEISIAKETFGQFLVKYLLGRGQNFDYWINK